jgi:hypothetical protein
MAVKQTTCQLNLPTYFIARHSKIAIFGLKTYHLATLLHSDAKKERRLLRR